MSDLITFSTPYTDSNVFAKILRGELPNITVYENDHCLAFMDIMPQREGHTLVIPKEPAVTFLDISPEALATLIQNTQIVARAVQKGLNAEGFSIVQLNGSRGGQTVPHIHFHILPGSILDAGAHATVASDPAHLEAVASKIRAAF